MSALAAQVLQLATELTPLAATAVVATLQPPRSEPLPPRDSLEPQVEAPEHYSMSETLKAVGLFSAVFSAKLYFHFGAAGGGFCYLSSDRQRPAVRKC